MVILSYWRQRRTVLFLKMLLEIHIPRKLSSRRKLASKIAERAIAMHAINLFAYHSYTNLNIHSSLIVFTVYQLL